MRSKHSTILQAGNAALGTYMDKHHPRCGEDVCIFARRSKALPVYLPELERYLLEYPEAHLKTSDPSFIGRR